ncbi:MAG: hypothetical protein KDK76_04920, partial [Chlamydiia bacterium]|nr:hypothetical protein [Chlamydiia bacterium]
ARRCNISPQQEETNMSMQLELTILSRFIVPGVSNEAIQEKTQELGLSMETKKDLLTLSHSIRQTILGKISDFLLTKEANDICPRAKNFNARVLYMKNVADNLDKNLTILFPELTKKQPGTITTENGWTWEKSLFEPDPSSWTWLVSPIKNTWNYLTQY